MKILKRIGIGLLILILLLIVVSFFLPSKVHVERSIVIKALPEAPFALVNDLKQWHQWSPWHQIDSTTVFTYTDITAGAGASYTWKSNHPKVGEGKLTITKSEPFSLIESEMDFGGMGLSKGTYTFTPVDDQVKVTWTLDSDGKGVPWNFYVMSKYFNLFMDRMIGPDFEAGLRNLKAVSEAMPVRENVMGYDLERRNIGDIMVLSVRTKASNAEIGKKLGEHFAMIGALMQKTGAKEGGRPMLIWHGFDASGVDMESAVPVAGEVQGEGEVQFSTLPATKAIVVQYYGPYNRIAPVFEAVKNYMVEKSIEPNGSVRQVYVVDPGMEADTSKWLTEIVVPVL